MTLTSEEVIEALSTGKNIIGTGHDGDTFLVYAGEDVVDEYSHSFGLLSLFGHSFKLVELYGGEDQGSEYYVIVEYQGMFFKRDGWYDSWDGVEWNEYGDSWFEVKPVIVPTTKYERV